MANGNSPVPKMPSNVFDLMKGWTWSGGGYYESNPSDLYYLRVIGAGDGGCEWALCPGTSWPSDAAKMLVYSADNDILAGSTLDEDGYVFTDGEDNEYRLHSNDGTPRAYLAIVE